MWYLKYGIFYFIYQQLNAIERWQHLFKVDVPKMGRLFFRWPSVLTEMTFRLNHYTTFRYNSFSANKMTKLRTDNTAVYMRRVMNVTIYNALSCLFNLNEQSKLKHLRYHLAKYCNCSSPPEDRLMNSWGSW